MIKFKYKISNNVERFLQVRPCGHNTVTKCTGSCKIYVYSCLLLGPLSKKLLQKRKGLRKINK